jgi:signal transduction histidine kinase
MPPSLLRSRVFAISLAACVAVAGAMIALFATMVLRIGSGLERETRALVDEEVSELLALQRDGGIAALREGVAVRSLPGMTVSGVLLLADADGRRIEGTLAGWPEGVAPRAARAVDFRRLRRDGSSGRVRARVAEPAPGLLLLVGRDPPELARRDALVWRTFGIAAGCGLLAAFAAAWLLARVVARRLAAITPDPSSLHAAGVVPRLRARADGDEFDRYAAALDALLERSAQLLTGVRLVGEGIAHDVRLPLTRLRARLEALREGQRDAAVRSDLGRCIADADHMLGLFDALLRIARIEAGAVPLPQASVDLAALADDAVDFYVAAAEERGMSLVLDAAPCAVRGDRDLLLQALTNLLDNALKFGGPGQHVAVSVRRDGGDAVLDIVDQGPGIPEAERARVFDRFYRGSRATGVPGSGLGLTLVAAIVRLHGGRITLEDARPGLRAVVRLPARD